MTTRNYVVLGAAGGIGSETCRRLRQNGSQVLLGGRNEEHLKKLAAEVDSPYRVLDATSIDQVETCVDEAKRSMDGLDGIVNCVGSVLLKPAHRTSPAEWNDTISTNLTSAFAAVRAGYKALRDTGGAIVLISTAAARVGLPNHEAIAAAKAGVIGLMQSAAASYAPRGIRINVVAPGLVRTGMTERIWSNEKSAEVSRSMHAIGRLGEPGDVASLLVWLLDPENDWITGQVFGVDGGLATLRVTGRSN
jgi:NAD(P)-dependent dehydrogenase (short-subunit alcohol dehydrogenase family)